MSWIIRRTDGAGGYYTGPGREKVWTKNRYRAFRFETREAAQAECCSNETPEPLHHKD